MRSAIQKLKSQTGASITFALLLFLVCAVISSVVIVAATTAAGRMSQLPEMDQRYYAVTSAARLLQHEIDGKTVVVTKTVVDEKTTYDVSDGSADAILSDASKYLVRILDGDTPNLERVFELTADGFETLKCAIAETLGKNSLLTFEISNLYPNPPTGKLFKLWIVFSPNIKTSVSPDDPSKTLTTLNWKFHSMRKQEIG